jgi:hypothetical protein
MKTRRTTGVNGLMEDAASKKVDSESSATGNLVDTSAMSDVDESHLEKTAAQKEVNGRQVSCGIGDMEIRSLTLFNQIKNIIKTARTLVVYENKTLSRSHLKIVIDLD